MTRQVNYENNMKGIVSRQRLACAIYILCPVNACEEGVSVREASRLFVSEGRTEFVKKSKFLLF